MFRNMKYLISFAAGVFFMTALSLSQETFEMLDLRDGALAVIIGFVAIWLVHIFFPETHHHHDHECKHHDSRNAGIKVLVGDTIHNTGDGIMLVTAFSISTELGVFAALSIFVHEFFQEISEFFVLREAGYSIKQTLVVNALSALSIFIGIGIGIFLTQSVNLQGFLLGITAGIFFHIVVHDLFPFHSVKNLHTKKSWKHLVLFMSGVLLLMFVGFFTPHGHEEEKEIHQVNNYTQ